MKHFLCLSDIKPGQSVRVAQLTCTGSIRRRLLDIGLTEHTLVTCLGASPAGDPRAYQVRGAVIAIRREDSSRILVEPIPAPDGPADHF